MKAEELQLSDIVRFSEGALDIRSRRLVLHDIQAFGQLQRDLIDMLGSSHAKRVLTRFGYFWGQADASSMKQLFEWSDVPEMIRAGARLQTIFGIAETTCDHVHFDERKESLEVVCTWKNSGIASAYVAEMGTAKEPACWLMTGYMSGFASYIAGKSVYFVEDSCHAKGDDSCSATGRDIDSWGNDIKPHLDYFHTVDIQDNIGKLTGRLADLENKLKLQRSLLDRAITGSSLSSVEIKSLQFQQIMILANKVAKYDSSVLITGETGVGKEMLARHIHSFSPRANEPFIAVNCAALTDTLLENELFGHEAGSFTGASKQKRGLFEEAHKGVIFLDEIGDITANLQVKLLRVLQEREIMRVGGTKPISVDFRLICATNKNLEKAVEAGTFRDDLFYRLQVIHILIPPLRDRYEDILPLVRHFIGRIAERMSLKDLSLDPACIDYLLRYDWPGNIRELENAIEHAAIMCADSLIVPEDLPSKILSGGENPALKGYAPLSLDEIELAHIKKVLLLTGGNREDAAKILKIGIATLYRKLAIIKSDGR